MKNIEARWQEYKSMVYPTMPDDSEQCRQLKSAWFASFFDAITLFTREIPEMSDEAGIELIRKMDNEAQTYIQIYIKQETERQAAYGADVN